MARDRSIFLFRGVFLGRPRAGLAAGVAGVALAALGLTGAWGQGQAQSTAKPAAAKPARGWVWVEGEKPAASSMKPHPWYSGQVKRSLLSGGGFLTHWDADRPGEALYRVNMTQAGDYDLWLRANPVQAKLSYRVNDGPWAAADLERDQSGSTNIAEDGKPDLRFVAWSRAGKARLNRGVNVVRFRAESANNHHAALDCFVLALPGAFTPNGLVRPDQAAAAARLSASANPGWFPFTPPDDPFRPGNALDLRPLNEKQAGDGGFIAAKGGAFVHADDGRPVRFWAVNGLPGNDPESLRRGARVLAKRGVNLVRLHQPYYDEKGAYDPAKARLAREQVAALKAEGIYSHFSIYFPLWLKPAPNTPWLPGYDGQKHPFAALMFHKGFQDHYRDWWKRLLTTPDPSTGKRLVDDPAVAGVEVQNEDSFFFWTFNDQALPDPLLRELERKFGAWAKARYGSPAAALAQWGRGTAVARDAPDEGRLGFRPLWNMANQRTPRDRDTARFLADTQRTFYEETEQFLRGLGFEGVVTASNWTTANAEVLTPIEKLTYTATDFLDRHGYFGCGTQGEAAEWSLRDGHTYVDRSALRFDPEEPGKPRVFAHPAIDPSYAGKPSMVSETTFNRPNRYRSEAPLYYAAYGALQGSDAVVHFAFDASRWAVKPNFFMQPWTLATPAMLGQFPAAALIYRQGLVAEGDVLADVALPAADVLNLKGTPLPQDAGLDELRLKDVPRGASSPAPGQVIDPLVHYAGRASVRFEPGRTAVKDLRPYIDHAKRTVTSTHGQLRLDYGLGLLTLNAPAAQGASGALKAGGPVELADLSVRSGMELGHVVAVSLDGRPLKTASRILLQVMSEEKADGFRAERQPDGRQKILSIGRDPWLVREFDGAVRLKRPDAASLRVTALDPNGDPLRTLPPAAELRLEPAVLYYLIEANAPAR